MSYDNEMKGVLFKNDKKKYDAHPDYKGSIQIEGREYWLSSWINEKKDGSGKYMSLKAQLKEHQTTPQSQHNGQGDSPNQGGQQQRQQDPFAKHSQPDSFGGGQQQGGDIPF